MVKSMFAAVAGLRTHQAKMDVIGNNIANVNTYGFKKARATFRDQFYATMRGASEANEVYGGGNPSQVGYGSSLSSVDVDYGTASGQPTGNSMDVMIAGNGFFLTGRYAAQGYDTISGVDATGKTVGSATNLTNLDLTRVGIFYIDGQGNLLDSMAKYVYGFANNSPLTYTNAAGNVIKKLEMLQVPLIYVNANGDPVEDVNGDYITVPYTVTNPNTATATYTIDANKQKIPNITTPPPPAGWVAANGDYVAPMKLTNVSIGTDGTVRGMNDLGKVIVLGQIAIANVPNPNALENQSNGYYKAKANTGVVTGEIPGQGSTGILEPGRIEMANVDLAQEFTDMITTQRGFQANGRIITVTDEMLAELVNLKR